MAADRKPINCRTGGIDQAESNALPGLDLKNGGSLGGAPIDEQNKIRRRYHLFHSAANVPTARPANPAWTTTQGYGRTGQEVGQRERVLAVVCHVGFLIFHDQGTDQSAFRLKAEMGVIHESSGRRRVEFIDESAAGRDCRLRNIRDSVHGIVKRNTVPMYGGAFRQIVLYRQAKPLSLFCANLRARELAVIQPFLENSMSRNFKLSWLHNQIDFPQRPAAR